MADNQQSYYNEAGQWYQTSGGLFNPEPQLGNYQFLSIKDVIDNFMATYVGEGKILSSVNRSDVSFHAHRALQELSYDTFKSCKDQEFTLPPSLTVPLPNDYVNYVKFVWTDSNGLEHVIYPQTKSSNPQPIQQSVLDKSNIEDFELTAEGTLTTGSNVVVLDGEYPDILVGMRVKSQSFIQANTKLFFVGSKTTTGGISTITIVAQNGTTPVPSNFGTGSATGSQETIGFHPYHSHWSVFDPNHGLRSVHEPLQLQHKSAKIISNLTWTAGSYQLVASSTADIEGLEVGMKLNHEDWWVRFFGGTSGNSGQREYGGVTITAINNNVVTIDWPPSVSSSGQITFFDEDIHSDTWENYSSNSPKENNVNDDDNWWPYYIGQRFGLDPQHAHTNGSFFIDCSEGKVYFSSNLSGKTIIMKYISDGIGTPEETQVPKLAEEAVYKWIIYGCLISIINIPEYVIQRFKKEKIAETRKAKLRLSNIKLEEITQILRGKSKQIKH